jgi:hypothetical protein
LSKAKKFSGTRIIINEQWCGSGELHTVFGFYLSGLPGSSSGPNKKANFLMYLYVKELQRDF